jgi:hypothetical protein
MGARLFLLLFYRSTRVVQVGELAAKLSNMKVQSCGLLQFWMLALALR